MWEIEREAAASLAGQVAGDSQPCAEVDKGDKMPRSSSANSNDDSLVEEETIMCAVVNKAVQVKPLTKSQKSQAKFHVCYKCADWKAEIRLLKKQNKRLQSLREEWKTRTQQIQVS